MSWAPNFHLAMQLLNNINLLCDLSIAQSALSFAGPLSRLPRFVFFAGTLRTIFFYFFLFFFILFYFKHNYLQLLTNTNNYLHYKTKREKKKIYIQYSAATIKTIHINT